MGKIGQKTRTKLGLIDPKPGSLEELPADLSGELIGLLKAPNGNVVFVRLQYENGQLTKVLEQKGPDKIHFVKQNLMVATHRIVYGDI